MSVSAEVSSESKVEYRWINGGDCSDEAWTSAESILSDYGYKGFARGTTLVLFGFRTQDGAPPKFAGFMLFQLFPQVGPAFVAKDERGTGVAAEMAEVMMAFLNQLGVSFLAIAESKHTERLCLMHGMKKLDSPVYLHRIDK